MLNMVCLNIYRPKTHGRESTEMTYYAIALRPDGKIGQMLVRRENGKQVSQVWTAVTYANHKAALADLSRLNA